MQRMAVYPGSFDPLTKGHLWVIREGMNLFDKVIVAVATNPDKKYVFSTEERVSMIWDSEPYPTSGKMDVRNMKNLLTVDFAKEVKAGWLLRGIRNFSDLEQEMIMRDKNKTIDPTIETVFLITPPEIRIISSSMIKGLTQSRGWEKVVKNDLPEEVYPKFVAKYKERGL